MDSSPDSRPNAEVAAFAAAVERWAGDLALGEEPARFLTALEEGAPPEPPTSREPSS